ncbi:MAG: IclR family transcriptional regulator, partial [bacterium]|nr:IclR family transcriptional regulator [bacterium]
RTSSELFRMVATLEKRDYIIRDPATGAYRLSMKLYEMSHMHSPVENLVRAAREPMRELANAVRESCHLSVLERGRLVVVAEEASREPVRLSVEVGSTAPALLTVSGRVLLAHLPEAELRDFLAKDPEYQGLSRRKQAEARKELEKIRGEGFTAAPSAYRVGTDVAVIVGVPEIGVAASLAIPCLAGGVNDGK